MSKLGLFVSLEAKPGKEEEVDKFLRSALPLVEQEPGTRSWFAIRHPGTANFGIFDTFDNEDGRQAHVSGKVAEALFARAEELFAKPPKIQQLNILTEKLPK